jgi:hypothetical protein
VVYLSDVCKAKMPSCQPYFHVVHFIVTSVVKYVKEMKLSTISFKIILHVEVELFGVFIRRGKNRTEEKK